MSANQRELAAPGAEVSRQALTRLKWFTTLVPAAAAFGYETIRHNVFGELVPAIYANVFFGLATLVLAYAFSLFVFGIVERSQRRALARSREIAALSAAMEERERLGREIHDGVAQLVAYMLVRIDTVMELVASDRREDALAELERLRSAADDVYVDVRESITGLRAKVSTRGFIPALEDSIAVFEERHGVPVRLLSNGLDANLSPVAAFQLLRVVQEALANVRKHARAGSAFVALSEGPERTLELTIGDDGVGFDPAAAAAARRSVGLETMRERAASIGGTLQITSVPGAGTRVVVVVPRDEAEQGTATDGSLAPAAR